MKRGIILIALFSSLFGCIGGAASAPPHESSVTSAGECQYRTIERAYFGLQTPNGEVSAGQWKEFVATVVTPKFPAGLTVLEGRGQWLGDSGTVVQESSRILEILHDGTSAESEKLRSAALEYRRRFDQDAVMILKSPVQACFYTRASK